MSFEFLKSFFDCSVNLNCSIYDKPAFYRRYCHESSEVLGNEKSYKVLFHSSKKLNFNNHTESNLRSTREI